MSSQAERDVTAEALAAAMRGHVAGVEAQPDVLDGAYDRARHRRRDRLAVAATAAAVLLVAGAAVTFAGLAGSGRRPVAAPSPAAPVAPRPRYAPAVLPAGFDPAPFAVESGLRPPGGEERTVYSESLRYGRGFGPGRRSVDAVIHVETVSGDVEPVTLASFRDTEPGARTVRVGRWTAIHVSDTLDSPNGLDVYHLTVEPGVNVSVIGKGKVTDAEVREVVASLRRVQ